MPSLQACVRRIREVAVEHNGCLLYLTNRRGRLWCDGVLTPVTRIMYTAAYGAPPAGLHMLHLCDNESCCNPAHLWAGTQYENTREAVERGLIPSESPLFGVVWEKSRQRWKVQPRINGKKTHLYSGKDLFEAACRLKAWQNYEEEHSGWEASI